MNEHSTFVEVILPLAVPGLFTYSVPDELLPKVAIGKRVLVQLGRHKLYAGIVESIHQNEPSGFSTKQVIEVMDDEAIIHEQQLELWRWMSRYYMCYPGEIMQAALPAVFKIQSESKIKLSPAWDGNILLLTDKENLIIDTLEDQAVLSLKDVSRITGLRNPFSLIRGMMKKNAVEIIEDVQERYKPKIVKYVEEDESFADEKIQQKVFDDLEKRAPKQLQLLLTWFHLKNQKDVTRISQKALLTEANVSASVLQQLVAKNVFRIISEEEYRMPGGFVKLDRKLELNEHQKQALTEIEERFKKHSVVLLHGITSSGKTELYVKQVEQALENNGQALYLLPEIALTTQIIHRLRKRFGDSLLVYHSKFSNQERADVWKKVLRYGKEGEGEKRQLIVGARSAIFLPYSDLKMVIVDEEHDSSFKQFDPAPRYHARDTSIVMANHFKARVLLGTATPSLESYSNAIHDKYGLVTLLHRYGNVKLPHISLVDLKNEKTKKGMISHFSTELINRMKHALEKGEQVILFQNRRGFAPYLQCMACLEVTQCKNCDASLTYHKASNRLQCHYCGYIEDLPARCPKCNDRDMRLKGFGTEKIEEELEEIFPEQKIQRLDLDSTRSKHSYARIISDFESGQIDILVGTQMVTKGLDFENVSTVGILNADSLIYFPDFRATERSFQLMTQVSGRAGRKYKQGQVIIQSYHPSHRIIQQVIDNDFEAFYRDEVSERQPYAYPPYARLIEIRLKMKNEQVLEGAANELQKMLFARFGDMVKGPQIPLIPRIKNLHIRHFLIKAESGSAMDKVKSALAHELDVFLGNPNFKRAIVQVDVDPM